ncbi:MAG: hypothetical protein ATN34_03295 [Epulopiscium sp. Nele67-Bin002]|nr:MAG: hypothetical protein BEN18_11095 [Epulopiscium sp. Nuni2H_MBin001]OON91752.1 MAG: hypothetical protein ATN34_03295 [Epulopiscium sp. Nele67-Bin002]OON93209.1 MAG: hypothetical protein ATN33_00575 [Epulopiscium sp. Nele67-Bin001]
MNIADAISLTISSMLIVFLTLFIISLMLQSFKTIFPQQAPKPVAAPQTSAPTNNMDVTEEEKVVVALMASILAAEDKDNPNLHITGIKRIK